MLNFVDNESMDSTFNSLYGIPSDGIIQFLLSTYLSIPFMGYDLNRNRITIIRKEVLSIPFMGYKIKR